LIRKQDIPHTLRYRETSGIDCKTCDDITFTLYNITSEYVKREEC